MPDLDHQRAALLRLLAHREVRLLIDHFLGWSYQICSYPKGQPPVPFPVVDPVIHITVVT